LLVAPLTTVEAMAGAVAAAEGNSTATTAAARVEQHCSRRPFAARIEAWLSEGL